MHLHNRRGPARRCELRAHLDGDAGGGGGIVAEGKLLHGVAGAAGELGHITVDFDQPILCTCGKKGCLETVASATGIVNLTRRYADEYAGDAELKQLIDNGEDVSAKIVFDLAKAGDELALIVYRNFARYLGIACANIGSILNPSTIVIGGGVSAAGEFLLDGVRKVYEEKSASESGILSIIKKVVAAILNLSSIIFSPMTDSLSLGK